MFERGKCCCVCLHRLKIVVYTLTTGWVNKNYSDIKPSPSEHSTAAHTNRVRFTLLTDIALLLGAKGLKHNFKTKSSEISDMVEYFCCLF